MSIFTLIAGIGPDDWDEYETGAIDQRDRCEHEARILAFGAIRRAAALARRLETDQDEIRGDWHAYYIRCAIRLAIASDKAST